VKKTKMPMASPGPWLSAQYPSLSDDEKAALLEDLRTYYKAESLTLAAQIGDDPKGVAAKVREYRRIYARGKKRQAHAMPASDLEVTDDAELIDDATARPLGAWLTPEENARAGAMMRFWAHLAALDPDVQRFRREILGGKLLATLEDAAAFLSSPALAVFSHRDFVESRVPLVGHVAHVIEDRRTIDGETRVRRVSMRLTPSNVTIERTYTSEHLEPIVSIYYPNPATRAFESQWVRAGSVLHDLLDLSETLVRRCEWKEEHAPLFVVSGEIPYRSPLDAGTPISLRAGAGVQQFVTLKIEPWVSAKTVRESYQRLQREVYREQIPKSVSIRNAHLFGYALRYMGEGGSLPAESMRKTIFTEWNALQSDASMKFADLGDFNRALRETHGRFLRLHSDRDAFYRRSGAKRVDSHPDSQRRQ